MFHYVTVIAPTTAAVSTPVEILTTDADLMLESVSGVAIQATSLAGEELVTVWEGKGPTPLWEQAYVWGGPPVEIGATTGSVCMEGRGIRYAVTKTATASPVGVYVVLQYEPR
jgi:hypothetical protein